MNRVVPGNGDQPQPEQPQPQSEGEKRLRWLNRPTFILAAIGSAIGLTNFWRFPYLCYKHGGGTIFMIPYLLALFLIGIPMLLLELTLGQKFQRGDIGVFRGIHPRLIGIGLGSIFSALTVVVYQCVILAWIIYYLALSFIPPLEWSNKGYENDNKCDAGAAYEFYFRRVLKYLGDDCMFVEPKDTNEVAWSVWLCCFVAWCIVYLCVFKGVRSSSYVVWITVPLPVVLIFILLIRSATLDGASRGVDIYMTGEDGTNLWDQLQKSDLLSDAIGQIFFSLSL
jgi:SNF family Na+-dependent transporter